MKIPMLGVFMIKHICRGLFGLLLLIEVSSYFAEKCGDCWVPDFNFDLEGRSRTETIIFISGHSYSLSESKGELKRQGKVGFFCKKGSVGSRELIEILNTTISGRVTAEKVSISIVKGVRGRYPCSSSLSNNT